MPSYTCTSCGTPYTRTTARQRKCEACTPHGRVHRSPSTRAQNALYQRNRRILLQGDPLCHWGCGRPATTADHLVPVSRGGGHEPSNLVPACSWCNGSKGDRAAPAGHHAPPPSHPAPARRAAPSTPPAPARPRLA